MYKYSFNLYNLLFYTIFMHKIVQLFIFLGIAKCVAGYYNISQKKTKEVFTMDKKDIKKVVLAYSGGLDTSIIIPWL